MCRNAQLFLVPAEFSPLEHLGISEIAHFAAILNRGMQEFRKEFKINGLLIPI